MGKSSNFCCFDRVSRILPITGLDGAPYHKVGCWADQQASTLTLSRHPSEALA